MTQVYSAFEWDEAPAQADEEPALRWETDEEQAEYARLTDLKSKGLITEQYYNKFLYKTGRVVEAPKELQVPELRFETVVRADGSQEAVLHGLKPFRGCAKARKRPDGQTPKPKRAKPSECTPAAKRLARPIYRTRRP